MSVLLPLNLQVNTEGVWRLYSTRKHDERFEAFAKRIWARDDNACQYCGFRANQYMEVLNVDGNYRNNDIKNMVTACPFCAQCQFLEMAGRTDYGGGLMIHMPEMTQAEINGLCHICYCAIAGNTEYTATAQGLISQLRKRSKIVDEKFGDNMSDPVHLSQMLVDAPVKEPEMVRESILRDLRLLPSQRKFSKLLEAWTREAIDHMKDPTGAEKQNEQKT